MVFIPLPLTIRFPIVRSFEEDTVPAVSVAVPIVFIVGSKFMLPLEIANTPTLNLEFKNGVKLDPPPRVNVELEISLFIATELLKIFMATLLVKLPDMVIKLGVLIVSEPTLSSLPAKSMEVKPDPERIKLGVTLEVIDPVRVRLPVIVKFWLIVLSQFTLLLDTKNKLDIVEVANDIGACPVLVTYTFGTLVVPNEADIFPTPLPPK